MAERPRPAVRRGQATAVLPDLRVRRLGSRRDHRTAPNALATHRRRLMAGPEQSPAETPTTSCDRTWRQPRMSRARAALHSRRRARWANDREIELRPWLGG